MKVNCPLCANETILKCDKWTGYQEPTVFSIYHCSNCNTAFSMLRCDTTKLYDLIYNNSSHLPGYSEYLDIYREIKQQKNPLRYLISKSLTYWSVNYALTKMLHLKSGKIFEIGCGYGYLTYALHEAGYDIKGLDVSKSAVSQAKKYFGDYYVCGDLFEYAKLYPESADAVILTEVIEHVEQPLAFMSALAKILKPGGSIILTTPNKSFYPEDVIWSGDNPPVHCWWFSEESIKYMADSLNLSIHFLDYSNSYQVSMSPYNQEPALNSYILDADGKPIPQKWIGYYQGGIFPVKFKRSSFYQSFSQRLYPTIAKIFYPSYKRTCGLCAVLSKK